MNRPWRRTLAAFFLMPACAFTHAALLDKTGATFTAAVHNTGNEFSVTNSFPSYDAVVQSDTPSNYYRMDDPVSSAATSVAADSSAGTNAGTYPTSTDGPTHWWRFDENSGTTAYDRAGGGYRGTLGAGATWPATGGKIGAGVGLAGTATGYVASATSPARTDASFSVSTWVKLSAVGSEQAVVSQGTGTVSAFTLKHDSGAWHFAMPQGPSSVVTDSATFAVADAAVLNKWVHLTGVYDDSANAMHLYVDGTLRATAPRADSSDWHDETGLNVGRARAGGAWTAAATATVDDVRVFNRVINAAKVTQVVAGIGDPPVADWRFDDWADRTRTTDASGNGNTLSLTGVPAGAGARTSGANGTPRALPLNGTAYGQAPRPVIRIDQSFTVAAWLRNDDPVLTNEHRAITQPGTRQNAFTLEHRPATDIGFSFPHADMDNPTWSGVHSTTKPATGVWYHVVGVYDAATNIMRLYINGTQEGGDVPRPLPGFHSTNPTQIGRGIFEGAYASPWLGAIDGVVIYQRALTAAEVNVLRTATAPAGYFSAGQPGALGTSSAVAFSGTANAATAASTAARPTNYSVEYWFRTDSASGGVLIGFGSPASGQGNTSDKLLFLNSAGRLVYGLSDGTTGRAATSAASYNDGSWHHAVATVSSTAGTTLYVDGAVVASNALMTTGDNVAGFWRWGGTSTTSWSGFSASDYYVGLLDEVAVYPSVLTSSDVRVHYFAGRR